MELNVRKGGDRFVPPGAYRELEARLSRRAHELSEIPAVVVSCFDRSSRMLPFVLYDKFMFPAGARTIAVSVQRRIRLWSLIAESGAMELPFQWTRFIDHPSIGSNRIGSGSRVEPHCRPYVSILVSRRIWHRENHFARLGSD